MLNQLVASPAQAHLSFTTHAPVVRVSKARPKSEDPRLVSANKLEFLHRERLRWQRKGCHGPFPQPRHFGLNLPDSPQSEWETQDD